MTPGTRAALRRACCAAVACGALAYAAAAAPARAQPRAEYEVKAAFLFNFVKFVEWPASAFENAQSPIRLCIAGDDPFAGGLQALVRGEQVRGRPLEVKVAGGADAVEGCHLLFVPAALTSRQAAGFAARAQGAPVLTVGDDADALEKGCAIAFEMAEQRVRFAINPRAASRAGLKLSARLLQVARIVEPEER